MAELSLVLGAVRRLDRLEGADAMAWQTVKAALVAGRPPFPPTAMGGATNAATALADHFAKTGMAQEWATPPLHSQAMERLIFRMTCLLEAFLDVYEASRAQAAQSPGSVPADRPDGAAMDELYQTSYCDECGRELQPGGDCQGCDPAGNGD